jgi:D-xylose transport system permease protein
MSSVEAPVVTVRAPLTPRLVELLSGEWRYVPILTAIALIWIFFGAMDPKFLSPRNLSNLSLQSIVTGTLALGLVPVLIIRQIDMSVAAVSGVAATITGQLLLVFEMSVWLAIAAGVLFGIAVGFLQARWITWTRAPGFLVTFGVSLILAAVQLRLLPKTGQINLFGTDLTFLAGSYVHKSLSWWLVTLAAAAFAVFRYLSVSDAMKAGLHATILKNVVVPTLAVLLVVAVAVAALNAHNEVPVALLLFILAIIVLSYVGSHTRFGIYLYAAGSNPSAVVRAGIKVDRIRIAAFMICGGFAASAAFWPLPAFWASRRNRRAWARCCSKRSRLPWWAARASSAMRSMRRPFCTFRSASAAPFLGGAIWASLHALLRVYVGVNELVVCLPGNDHRQPSRADSRDQ